MTLLVLCVGARGVLFLLSGGLSLSAALTGAAWSLSFAHAFESSWTFRRARSS